ncbi:MAG: His/Gly/Thr/Pro-type tRNA ligase C-terminal domain-containing protein, partial [Candidatus Shikimatogenerans sp. JK-2022]|nr:His/Gly/Thr/Pro-type tRNA ligase C-terminal domain-containing protein [Candidatus Shikimatogenerans bostrichidophilus]
VKFTNKKGFKKYVYGTSWGLSTRLIGAIIMIHNDEKGLILPPKIAPIQVIIIPIKNNKKILTLINKIVYLLYKKKIKVIVDKNFNITPGNKFYKYDNMGVPLKIIIGEYEVNNNLVELIRRDNLSKISLKIDKNLNYKVLKILNSIQSNIYKLAKKNMKKKIFNIKNYKSFKQKNKYLSGFFKTYWKNNTENEKKIQKETKATIRCIIKKKKPGKCFYSKKRTKYQIILGKSY